MRYWLVSYYLYSVAFVVLHSVVFQLSSSSRFGWATEARFSKQQQHSQSQPQSQPSLTRRRRRRLSTDWIDAIQSSLGAGSTTTTFSASEAGQVHNRLLSRVEARLSPEVASFAPDYARVVEEEIMDEFCGDVTNSTDNSRTTSSSTSTTGFVCRRHVRRALQESNRHHTEILKPLGDMRADGTIPYDFDLTAYLSEHFVDEHKVGPEVRTALVEIVDVVQYRLGRNSYDHDHHNSSTSRGRLSSHVSRAISELEIIRTKAQQNINIPHYQRDGIEAIVSIAVSSAQYWSRARRDPTNAFYQLHQHTKLFTTTTTTTTTNDENSDNSDTSSSSSSSPALLHIQTEENVALQVWNTTVVLASTTTTNTITTDLVALTTDQTALETVVNLTYPYVDYSLNLLINIAPYVLADTFGAIRGFLLQTVLQTALFIVTSGAAGSVWAVVLGILLGAASDSLRVAGIFIPNPVDILTCVLINLAASTTGKKCDMQGQFPPFMFDAYDLLEKVYEYTATMVTNIDYYEDVVLSPWFVWVYETIESQLNTTFEYPTTNEYHDFEGYDSRDNIKSTMWTGITFIPSLMVDVYWSVLKRVWSVVTVVDMAKEFLGNFN